MKIKYEDVCINSLWSSGEDERLVEKEFTRIQAGQEPAEAFDHLCRRVLDDQSARFYTGAIFEPLIVTEPKYDMMVNPGLIRIAQLVCGKSSQYFTYYASGTGNGPERQSDERLSNENYRVSMIADGYAEPAGTAMKFAGKFPSTVPSATISEGGVFDFGEINEGVMLFRTLYPLEARLPHVQYRTFYVLTQTIAQVSVT